MKAAGYQTALIGKNHAFFDAQNNYYPDSPGDSKTTDGHSGAGERHDQTCNELHRHFDYVFQGGHVDIDDAGSDPELQAAITLARDRSWQHQHNWSVNPYAAEKSITHRLTDEAMTYLREIRTKDLPFFLWFSIPDPHTPYQVSEPYASMFNPDTVPPPIRDSLDGKPERQKVAMIMDHNDQYNERHFRELRAICYGMIRQIDDNLDRFFRVLESEKLVEDTIIIFLSDHGDSLGDHGIIQKHNFFYDSFTRVPFIVSWPGHIEPRRTRELVELVDVMPSILDLSDIGIPYGVQGSSLRPFLSGEAATTKEFIAIESGEHGTPTRLADLFDRDGKLITGGTTFAWCAFREAWYGRGKAIRTDRWKLCLYSSGEGELYDMENDPDEIANLYDESTYAKVKADLTRKLAVWQMDKEDPIPVNTTVSPEMHLVNRLP